MASDKIKNHFVEDFQKQLQRHHQGHALSYIISWYYHVGVILKNNNTDTSIIFHKNDPWICFIFCWIRGTAFRLFNKSQTIVVLFYQQPWFYECLAFTADEQGLLLEQLTAVNVCVHTSHNVIHIIIILLSLTPMHNQKIQNSTKNLVLHLIKTVEIGARVTLQNKLKQVVTRSKIR